MLLTRFHVAISLAILLLIVPRAAVAQPGILQSPPPDAARAIRQGDQVFLNYAVAALVMETRTIEVEVDGKKEQREVVVCRTACQRRMGQVPMAQCRVFSVGGERLTDEQAAARLAKETAVLYTQSGKLLDPAYRALYPPETLVVYAQPQPPHGAVAFAAPPPPDTPQPTREAADSPPPAPKFAETPPDLGPPPRVAFLDKADDQAVITTYDWRSVWENKPVSEEIKDEDGSIRKVTKERAVNHWLPHGQVTKFKLADLAVVQTDGMLRGGEALANLGAGLAPVLIASADQPFDANHYKHFKPDVLIVRAEVQPAMWQQEFPNVLPPQETFAKVTGDKLVTYNTYYEQAIVKAPVQVVENGKATTKFEDRIQILTKTVGSESPLDGVKATDSKGQTVDSETLAKRLAKESLVLTWPNGWPVGEVYLTPVKPDTLNLVLPPLTPLAPGQRRPPAPEKALAEGLPPRFALAQMFGDVLVLREPQVTTIQVPKTVTKIVDGEQVTETVLEHREGTHWDERAVSWDDCRFASRDGQTLDYAAAHQRLASETMVLISDQGTKVDPAWLAIYKPAAVIVYLRPRVFHAPDAAPATIVPSP